ncbi:MAG: DHA2 family efflux MFS transporter permease subunit [Alphaproteobacteria bacterium]|nr:DHA2 family efflux MFS transporter permease subunit [Alphaproteobacteria bacterium]
MLAGVSRTALVALLAATALQALDLTIATIALPAMSTDLGLDTATAPWILTAYIVALALSTPTAGALSAALGRRNALLAAIGGLTLASLACAAAPGLGFLLAARVAQGAAAGLIMPLVQATLLDLVPKSGHGRAMSFFGAAVMVGPILGPSIGGVLVDTIGWRAIFLINVPIGLVALSGVASALAPMAKPSGVRLDGTGLAIFGGGIVGLQLLLERGPLLGWFSSRQMVFYALLMAGGLMTAVLRAARRRNAFPSLLPFADRNFAVATGCSFLAGFIVIGSIALVPMLLENAFGYTAASAGLAMTPRGIGTMVMMLAMNRRIGLIDHRILLWTGAFLNVAGLLGLAIVSPKWGLGSVAALSLVQGLGIGLIFTPLSTAAFSFLPDDQRTDATGTFSLLRHVGGGLGVATLTIFVYGGAMSGAQLLAAYHFDFLLLMLVSAVMAVAIAAIRTESPEDASRAPAREAAD